MHCASAVVLVLRALPHPGLLRTPRAHGILVALAACRTIAITLVTKLTGAASTDAGMQYTLRAHGILEVLLGLQAIIAVERISVTRFFRALSAVVVVTAITRDDVVDARASVTRHTLVFVPFVTVPTARPCTQRHSAKK